MKKVLISTILSIAAFNAIAADAPVAVSYTHLDVYKRQKCGYLGDPVNSCSKVPRCGEEYQSRISGPLLDRFDIRVEVPAINVFNLDKNEVSETSEVVSARVKKAREIQNQRYQNYGFNVNAYAEGKALEECAGLDFDSEEILKSAMSKFSLSMRGYTRILRVALSLIHI